MRYIDAEKLIAEIEKKKKILVSEYNELAKYEVWRSAIDNKIKINTIVDILSLITSLQQEQPIDGGTFDVDAAFDTREPRDNWEYIKEFCDKFGRIPKDMDELDELVSYVMVKKQKEQKPIISTEESLGISQGEYNKIVDECIFGEHKEQQSDGGSSENPNNHAEWSEEDIKKIRSEEYTKGFNDAAFGGKLSANHTIWHNASEERPTKLPIVHIWYHGNRVNAVVTHENIGLQEELDDINFQPDDKWAYVEDLLNVQPQPITYVLDEPLGYDNDLNPVYPPINHWKPSEGQMEALKNSAYGAYQSGDGPALRELYDSLKKL